MQPGLIRTCNVPDSRVTRRFLQLILPNEIHVLIWMRMHPYADLHLPARPSQLA